MSLLVHPRSKLIRSPNLLDRYKKPIGPCRWAGPNVSAFVMFGANDPGAALSTRVVLTRYYGTLSHADSTVPLIKQQTSGIGSSHNGIFFDGSYAGASHNFTSILYTPTDSYPFPDKTYLAAGIVISGIAVTGKTAHPQIITSGAYNSISFADTSSVRFEIGNSALIVNIDSIARYEGGNAVSIVTLVDQRSSSKYCYVWINGNEYSASGTKDVVHDTNDGVKFRHNARHIGWVFTLEAMWYTTTSWPNEVLRQISVNPYRYLIPA